MIAVGAVITTVKFENTTSSAQTNVPVTFGQVFAVGDLPAASAAVELRAPDNSVVPCQLDPKVNHPDGSLRHGILSVIIPALAASASVTYSIVRKAAPATGAAPVPADFAGLNATVLLTETGTDVAGPVTGTAYTADAAALLAAGTYETWLSGPIVSEWIVRAPLKSAGGAEHPDLHARFSIRAYAGQARAKIDYIVENNWAKKKAVASGVSPWETVSVADKIYRFSLTAGATTVHTRATNGNITTKLAFNANGVYDGNATGLANDATVYTATITVDGVAKPISITGSAAQNFSQLRALLNTQLGGAATCGPDPTNLGLLFKSASTGASSSVVIAYGTLFPALQHVSPYRPIFGDEVVHYARARWKKTFWWGLEPAVHIAHNKAYLMATRAVPNYDPALTGSSSAIATTLAALKANEDIGQNGITKAYMGDVGFASAIGVLPEWAAMYLVNQGQDAKYILLKQADLGGSWPFHVRDYATDRPISFENWPYATFSPNAGDSYNAATGLQEKLPTIVPSGTVPANRNIPDAAHHPDLYFLPYLITGDHYYLEGLLFYQRFLGIGANSHDTYRGGRKCLWKVEQVRGMAWSLRTAVHALYVMPGNHSLRSDVAYIAEQNRLWFTANYIDPAGIYRNPLGAVSQPDAIIYTSGTSIAPWQDDFMTSAAGRAVELGFAEWLPWLQYKAQFPVGRLTSGTAYCWQLAALYNIKMRDTTASPIYTTFNQAYLASVSAEIAAAQCGSQAMTTAMTPLEGSRQVLNSMSGYPDLIGGYPANLQPAVAYSASYGAVNGANAWQVFDARAMKPDYNIGPQFAIIPRPQEATAVTAPSDNYQVASGKPMYFGRAAPPAAQAFDSLTFTNTTDGPPGAAENGKIMVVELHGSSGSNSTNGRQYRAQVSGSMALEGDVDFGFSTVVAWDGKIYTVKLRPIDSWQFTAGGALRESMHIGMMASDGKVHLTSERRYDTMMAWADANLTMFDQNKRILTGGSMGGWGTITYGIRRYNMFAALYPDRPRWRNDSTPNNVAVSHWDGGLVSTPIASSPLLAAEDGGGSYAAYVDMIAYVSNPANKVRPLLWCCGRQDGFATFADQKAAVVALRNAGRFFAFAWNDGNHSTGSIMSQIFDSYPVGTFARDKGYPLFTEHSGDQDPEVDLVGGINIGLSFRNVVESASGWSCEVTSVLGARTVKVKPISDTFKAAVAAQLITIPAASTWVPVSFTA